MLSGSLAFSAVGRWSAGVTEFLSVAASLASLYTSSLPMILL